MPTIKERKAWWTQLALRFTYQVVVDVELLAVIATCRSGPGSTRCLVTVEPTIDFDDSMTVAPHSRHLPSSLSRDD